MEPKQPVLVVFGGCLYQAGAKGACLVLHDVLVCFWKPFVPDGVVGFQGADEEGVFDVELEVCLFAFFLLAKGLGDVVAAAAGVVECVVELALAACLGECSFVHLYVVVGCFGCVGYFVGVAAEHYHGHVFAHGVSVGEVDVEVGI